MFQDPTLLLLYFIIIFGDFILYNVLIFDMKTAELQDSQHKNVGLFTNKNIYLEYKTHPNVAFILS